MKIALRYFSGTGNTAWLADRLKEALARRGATVSSANLAMNEDPAQIAGDSALLVLCYPVYALDAPQPVREWARNLPPGAGRAAVVVRSPGDPFFDGGTTRTMRRILTERGWRVTIERMIVMPPNIFVRASDDLAALLLAAARRRAEQLADDIVASKELLENTGLFINFAARLSAAVLGRHGHRFGRDLRAGAPCTRCGLCVRECPADTITMTVDGIRFGDRCMVCLRCISRCPVQAITPRRYTFFPVKNYDLAALDTADLSQLRPRNWFERGYRTYLERKSHQFAA